MCPFMLASVRALLPSCTHNAWDKNKAITTGYYLMRKIIKDSIISHLVFGLQVNTHSQQGLHHS